jgi:hypothetical protein
MLEQANMVKKIQDNLKGRKERLLRLRFQVYGENDRCNADRNNHSKFTRRHGVCTVFFLFALFSLSCSFPSSSF